MNGNRNVIVKLPTGLVKLVAIESVFELFKLVKSAPFWGLQMTKICVNKRWKIVGDTTTMMDQRNLI